VASTRSHLIVQGYPTNHDRRRYKWRVGTTWCQLGKGHETAPSGGEKCLGGRWKKVSPVAGPARGHSSETSRPRAAHTYSSPSFLTTESPQFLQPASYNLLPTPRVLFNPPATPAGPPCAHIVTLGYIGGNNLPWQGQRYDTKCLRQWNNSNRRDATGIRLSWDFFWRCYLGNRSLLFFFSCLTSVNISC